MSGLYEVRRECFVGADGNPRYAVWSHTLNDFVATVPQSFKSIERAERLAEYLAKQDAARAEVPA